MHRLCFNFKWKLGSEKGKHTHTQTQTHTQGTRDRKNVTEIAELKHVSSTMYQNAVIFQMSFLFS